MINALKSMLKAPVYVQPEHTELTISSAISSAERFSEV